MDRLYKFGKTTFSNVLDRFSETTHTALRWRAIPLSRDYSVRVIWSKWVLPEVAVEAEHWFATTYPKTFYSEIQYNGISECRNWTTKESYTFTDALDLKYSKDNTYQLEVQRLAETSELLNTYLKIYFVMLTKKQL